MEIDVLRSDFKRSVLACMGVSPLRGINPALSSILIETIGDDRISLKATDTELGLIIDIPANVKKEGKFLVNSKNLADVVKLLPEENIKLTSKNNSRIKLASGKSSFNFNCLPPSDFPTLIKAKEENSVRINSKTLRDAILKTIFAVPIDPVRYSIVGANFTINKGEVAITGTDNYRLVYCKFYLDSASPIDIDSILPKKAFYEIGKLLENEKEVSITYSQNKLFAIAEGSTLICQSLGSEFPNLIDAIPQGATNILQVDRKRLISSIRRVGVFSSDNAVTFDISDKNTMCIQSASTGRGEGSDEIEIEYQGEPMKVGFDSKYVLEVLCAMCEEKVRIDMNSSTEPTLFRRCEDNTYSCVVMPMRLSEEYKDARD
jgi:DNA polymerase-3 subunit beta